MVNIQIHIIEDRILTQNIRATVTFIDHIFNVEFSKICDTVSR